MNELELLTRMRAEVPLQPPSAGAADAVSAAIAGAPVGRAAGHAVSGPGPRSARRPSMRGPGLRRKLLICSAAAAVAVSAIVVWAARGQDTTFGPVTIPWSGRPAAPLPSLGLPSVGRARTGAQLVAFATYAAALAPARAPGPHEWVYEKVEFANSTKGGGGYLFGPPDEREFSVSWVRVDWDEYAGLARTFPMSMAPRAVVHGRLLVSPGGGGSMCPWTSSQYGYLNSLPTDPARLRAAILTQNNGPHVPCSQADPNVAVFSAIANLLFGQTEGVWLPPKLAAAMYRLLQQTPGVHFDTAVDLAGRTGLGFSMAIDGWQKEEVVVNPTTYSYMGDEWVALQARSSAQTGGPAVSKGQVLGWEALLASAIVQRPGQIP
jgi:hypothetical protein